MKRVNIPIFFYEILMFCIKGLLSIYLATLRVEIVDMRKKKEEIPTVYILWHDSLLAVPILQNILTNNATREVHILISKSKDGDIPSLLTKKYTKFFPLRVAHNARSSALRATISLLTNGCNIVITPDGPKGPRRKLKLGSWYAAKYAKVSITPISINWRKSFRLKSWDQFFIPFCFSAGKIFIHEPLSYEEIESSDPSESIPLLEKRLNYS